ncbi:serine/threonine protein kinase [Chondromyces apiculatus]|uniref:Serine/threonine protein kinase n=1 Tax=Chondromyces apiculatus DSM 436 TaxID=1192034 RepID=A0A017T7F7_9BACT|nr:serine/threonine-protein kinase [Chondromyces apiculatus]EYF04927.1 serine/threonine protein kinase [Chondromyces apiculatus DSM 436]
MTEARRLGPYVLREEIASGAFTATFRAEHVEIGREARVKVLKASVAPGGPLAAGLEREARILGQLDDPGVVAIQDVRREGGALGLVLEPVAGPTLAAMLARTKRLDPDVAAAIALQLARGLGHLHQRGVVHCALAAESVGILPGGGVKLLDLSAAREIGGRAEDEPFEALELGRAEGMAPEQILGEPPGPPADVFALGVLLYEMVAGEGPFGAAPAEGRPEALPSAQANMPASAQASTRANAPTNALVSTRASTQTNAWTNAHRVRRDPPRPLRGLLPEVPRGLEIVALRCLEKEPDQRYASGRVVAAALEEVLAERGYAEGAEKALVARALVSAKLEGVGVSAARREAAARVREPARLPAPVQRTPLWVEARPLLGILALVVLGGAAIEIGLRDHDEPEALGVVEGSEQAAGPRGYLRVLARPWAEVVLDGDLVDVTPIGRAIPVVPGRHYVTFRHPNAPEDKREVVIAAGQTVLLDVTLRVNRGAQDAGVDAAPRDESP